MRRSLKHMLARPSIRSFAGAFFIYESFYLALFFQFPYQNALQGNCGTVTALALSNTYIAKAAEWLGFGSAGTAMFPAVNTLAYGEAAPGMSAIYVLFRLLGLNDVLASYFFITLVFALTAAGAFVFAGLFIRSRVAKLFAGFAFTCSNMMFAHIDDSAVIFYLFPLLSFTYLIRFFRVQRPRLLLVAALFGGWQVYFSVYVFVYQTVVLGSIGLIYWYRQGRLPLALAAKACLLYGVVAAPVLLFYSLSKFDLNLMTPYHAEVLPRLMSFTFYDLFQALPENLIYGRSDSMPLTWDLIRHQNLLGLLVSLSALYALRIRGEHRAVLGLMALAGFVLALGPMVMAGAPTTGDAATEEFYKRFTSSAIAPAPLYPFYKMFPLMSFHRVPVRAYFLVLLALSLLSAITLEALRSKISSARGGLLVAGLFIGVHFFENVPFPLRAYPLGPLLTLPDEYATFVEGKTGAVILDLPSRLDHLYLNWDPDVFQEPEEFVFADHSAPVLIALDRGTTALSYLPLFHYTRDTIYMNWQTQHKQNIVGGVNGYLPVSRLIYDRWLEDLPGERAIEWLRGQGVDYIVFHPSMLLPGETDIRPQLANSPHLRQVYSGNQITVFSFVEPEL